METTRSKIMIVDDDPSLLRMTVDILKEYADTALSTSGPEALKYLMTKNDIDLILLDINMADMSGFQVLDELKRTEQLAAIPVALFSSSQDSEDVEKGIKKGAVGYILKPFTKEVLLEKAAFYLKAGLQKRIKKQCLSPFIQGGRDRIILDAFAKMDSVIGMLRNLPRKDQDKR